jgi:outer membrane receptor for ferric coprogen and ferric-rhodotorulic acid
VGSKAKDDTIVVYASGIDRSNADAARDTPVAHHHHPIADVLEYTTGVSVKRMDRGRNLLSARGFD